MLRHLLDRYRHALRDEPKLRGYLAAALVDDVGIAVTAWAMALLATGLFTDQRERAKLMLPTLVCFLAGTVVAGPLADWFASSSAAQLAHWRWRVVVWARAVETVFLTVLVVAIAGGAPSIGRVLPYMMVSAFMKTALRPTRQCFEVDLLRREETQLGADGRTLLDERGAARRYKTHLLSFGALTWGLRSAAALAGLVVGGHILAAVHGVYWPLFAFDVATNIGFIAVLALRCHPSLEPKEIGLSHLFGALPTAAGELGDTLKGERLAPGVLRRFGESLRDGARFLARRDQRPLVALLAGCWLVEVVTEAYDGKMIVRHVLGGSDTALRHAEIGWQLVAVLGTLALPALTRKVGSLGKIFLITMVVDGAVIALAGRFAHLGVAGAVLPFASLLAVDKSLTLVSSTLAELAQNSASSAALRGRIAAFYAFVVLVGDMGAEIVATAVSEAIGIPAMLVRIGLVQVGLVLLIALAGGRELWRFGLRTPLRASPITEPADVEGAVA